MRVTLVSFLLLAASCTSDSSQSKQHPSRLPTKAALVLEAGSKTLSDANLSSYWTDDDSREAAEFFRRDAFQAARQAFAQIETSDDGKAARINLMIAICDGKLGHHLQAAQGFEGALDVMPGLADYLHFAAARSYFFAHKAKDAMFHARAVQGASIDGADAELLIGDLLRGEGNAQNTYQHYKAYLQSRSKPIREYEARYRMAEAAAAAGNRFEAALEFKKITIESPLSRWSTRAEKQLPSLIKKLTKKKQERVERWSAQEYVTRGQVFYRSMRNEKSETDFAAALSAPELQDDLHCEASYYRANSVYKQRNRTKAAPLFLAALDSCEKAGNADLYVKAAYQAGRSFATLGEHKKAIAHYALIESKHPAHSYADDARLHQAEEYRELGDQKKVTELLSSISDLYPDGDMGTEALWRLAWRAYKNARYPEAIGWLEKQIAAAPIDDRFWAEGQAQYWIARAQGKLGKDKASVSAYRQVIADYPLSYYALLALNRLRESHSDVFKEVVSEIHRAPTGDEDGAFRFVERDEYKSPGFARAIEFLRLGLMPPAAAEMSRLGFKTPKGRERLHDPDAIDRTWAMSYLQNSIGNYGRGLWSTRWHILDYKRHWPEAGWRKRWDIAYPPGYWDIIEKRSKEQGIPTELAISFVREESSFDPTQESFANAIGLSQIIMPTARRFAEGTGIVVSRETLRDPDKNVQIGTRFMSFLMKKWDQQLSLIPPSYNAGEGAVAKWMRLRGDWDRDAWAEEIPYDETRRYSKRVISSYFTYRYLLHDEIPVFPNQF